MPDPRDIKKYFYLNRFLTIKLAIENFNLLVILMPNRFFLKIVIFCFFSLSFPLFAEPWEDENKEDNKYTPWFTGPLISPNAVVQPPGQIYEQVYLFDMWATRSYNGNWHTRSIPLFRMWSILCQTAIGLFDRVDVQVVPKWDRNSSRGHVSLHIEDLPVGFDYQIVKTNNDAWYPSVKVGIFEVLPTGKYQKLKPNKRGTDSTGAGSYRTQADLVFQNLYHVYDNHYLRGRFSLIYTYFHPTRVKGLNTFGGAKDTKGTVSPGHNFSSILGLEYTLTQNWVLSCECIYDHFNRTSFHGHPGFSAPGVRAVVGAPSKENLSFTPCIEYNVSKTFGFILGSWFSTNGRNTPKFDSVVFSVVYVYPNLQFDM